MCLCGGEDRGPLALQKKDLIRQRYTFVSGNALVGCNLEQRTNSDMDEVCDLARGASTKVQGRPEDRTLKCHVKKKNRQMCDNN